jgi:hypothetical protein
LRSRRSEPRAWATALALAVTVFVADSSARAGNGDSAVATEGAGIAEARSSFVQGSELAKQAHWAEALAAYERSAKLRQHAVTTYNIGICHRAMGAYTLARETFSRALAESEAASPPQLAESLVAEDRAYIGQIDALLATASVQLTPANASISVDGRPLEVRKTSEGTPLLAAGTRAPGPGEPPPSGTFRISLNPGAHVFTVSRAGFADAVVNRTFAPASSMELKLDLDRLPATIHVASSQPGAAVTFDGVDVGVTPLDLSRPAGTYHLIVRKPDFKPYEAQVAVQPGQELDLRAPLAKNETSITSRWWFWTAAGVLVAGVAAGTYALSRGETTHEQPVDGGGLGWAVKLK